MAKEIAADAQVGSPAPAQMTQTTPVSRAMVTNHSPRMNCLGGTPQDTSTYHRPAVGAITDRASTPRTGSPAFSAFSAPTIAYSGSENEVTNWNTPSRNLWPLS